MKKALFVCLFLNQEYTNNSTKMMAENHKFKVAAYKLAQYTWLYCCAARLSGVT